MAELYKFEHVGKRFSGPENLDTSPLAHVPDVTGR